MSRILTPPKVEWYDKLRAVAYYGETELEDWIYQHANSFFPHHYVIPFKKIVSSKRTRETGKPDLALIRHDFSSWVVVEVELSKHTLDHVLGQARVFLHGEYNLLEIAQYVRGQLLRLYSKHVALRRLMNLFDSASPSILVIADEYVEDWKKELGKLGVQFGIVEIYKNFRGHYIYRTFGEYPIVEAGSAQCRRHPQLANVLEVVGKFTFTQLNERGYIDVFYDEYLTQWDLFKESGRQYLRFIGISNPLTLSRSDTYGLYRDKSNKYYFKRS